MVELQPAFLLAPSAIGTGKGALIAGLFNDGVADGCRNGVTSWFRSGDFSIS